MTTDTEVTCRGGRRGGSHKVKRARSTLIYDDRTGVGVYACTKHLAYALATGCRILP